MQTQTPTETRTWIASITLSGDGVVVDAEPYNTPDRWRDMAAAARMQAIELVQDGHASEAWVTLRRADGSGREHAGGHVYLVAGRVYVDRQGG